MKVHHAFKIPGENLQGDPMNNLLVNLLSSSPAPCQQQPKKYLVYLLDLLC